MRSLWFLALLLFAVPAAWGQGGSSDCPGFRNTSSFNTGSTQFFWTARVGERTYTIGNESDTTTGNHIMSTCTSTADITGHSNITSSQYDSPTDLTGSSCNHNFFDANGSRFQIIGPSNAGTDQFTIAPGSSTGMPRIPAGYTHSVRLGDMRSMGQAQTTNNINNSTSKKGAEALFYTMRVTPLNALLFINYAVVARRYSHTAYDAGEFLIRVVKQNDDGSWPNAPINDSMWYKVSAPNFNGNELPLGWEVGAGNVNNWPCTYAYKPWSKVAINLNNYLYENVRIEMYTSDCIYNADPIYAYIAGDYQPVRITSSGCPQSSSSAIDTLSAPEGLLTYTWYVATQGQEEEIYNISHMDTVHFRQLAPVSTDNTYIATLDDFVLTEGPNAGDTVSGQTFLCVMTSALDPHKPFSSKVYANVDNEKPIPHISHTVNCDRMVTLHNLSTTFAPAEIDHDSTHWIIYSDSTGSLPLDTLWGDDVTYQLPSEGDFLVKMKVKVFGKDCGSEATTLIHVIEYHEVPILLSDTIVCEGETVTASCADHCYLQKQWQIGDSIVASNVDSITWQPTAGITVVQLTTTTDSLCPATTSTTVVALGNVTVTSDVDASIICRGDSVTLTANGIESPRWFSSPYDSTLTDTNSSVVVVAPSQTTTYIVHPTQATRCLQNESSITVIVLPYPVPVIWTNKPAVDIANPLLTIENRSLYATSSLWSFSDGQTDQGARIEHYFGSDEEEVSITLHTCNEERCCSDTTIFLPVQINALWIPNAFTPAAPQNSTFRFFSTLTILEFDIWVYNRLGQLVFHGTDFEGGWDGNTTDGTPCPQGAYAYHYSYSEASAPDRIHQGQGTVMLIR